MDAWRRKLDRMNARASSTSARHGSVEVKNWPKFLVAMGVIIIAILFANRESVIYLRDLPSAQAEQGDGRAQCRAGKLLGILAARGHGAPPNVERALEHFARAIDLGDPEAALISAAVAAGSPLL